MFPAPGLQSEEFWLQTETGCAGLNLADPAVSCVHPHSNVVELCR